MELSTINQAIGQLRQSNNILIVLPRQATLDGVASGLALQRFLRKLDKLVDVVALGAVPATAAFMPEAGDIKTAIPSTSNLVVTLDTSKTQLDELSYRVEDQRVNIFLKAKSGQFVPSDVSFSSDAAAYDLLVTLGAQSLEDVQEIYHQAAPTFYELPKLNVDFKADNEYFGSTNLIDVTSSSLGEILAQLLQAYEASLFDEVIATYLLAGIIARTNSFQGVATTPKTLAMASQLIGAGARHQDIIQHLFKTKDFSLLKLWGRALARIKTVPNLSLLYSTLLAQDFSRTNTDNTYLSAVLMEFLENVSGFQIVAILAETSAGIMLALAGPPHLDITALAQKLGRILTPAVPVGGLHSQILAQFEERELANAESQLLTAVQTVSPNAV